MDLNTPLDEATLLRHTRPGPRYTSYPTAPIWTENFSKEEFVAGLRTVGPSAAVYVHVPFCREQCSFCGCTMAVAGRREPGKRYLAALERQIEELALPERRISVERIHLGGGTPTWYEPGELEDLFELLYRRFVPGEGCEISVEADPEVTTPDHLAALAGVGVNRMSFGVQSFDDTVLAAVQRPQQRERIRHLLDGARAHGMHSLNLDLMYGLPYQRLDRWEADLDETLRIRPDRLAVFGYAHVPWLKPHMKKLPTEALPSPLERVALFLRAHERLSEAGYQAVGMDHFSLPGDALAEAQRGGNLHRNFMGYTTHPDQQLIGLGMSAISDLGDRYVQQKTKLSHWWNAVEAGESVIEKGWTLSAEDRLRREVINQIMCNFRLSGDALLGGPSFWDRFPEERSRLQPLAEDGLVEISTDGLFIPERARLLVRNVAMIFDAYLGGPSTGKPRFSSTV